MAIALGLLAALAWGTGDFAGGLASRRSPETAVVLGTEVIGLVLLLAIAGFVGGDPTGRDLGFGAGAGLLGVAGLVFLYRGLARGRASVVAPISAVGAAVLQVAWGLGTGEQPGALAIVGIICALVAIAIVAGAVDEADADAPHTLTRRQEVTYGLLAAVGFGCYLILISETSDTAGLWTVVAARAAPVAVLVVALPLLRRPVVPKRDSLPLVTLAGDHGRGRQCTPPGRGQNGTPHARRARGEPLPCGHRAARSCFRPRAHRATPVGRSRTRRRGPRPHRDRPLMESRLFDDVADAVRGLCPDELGTVHHRAHRYGIKVWFGAENAAKEHYEAQVVGARDVPEARTLALEVGFHSEHPKEPDNEAVVARLRADERTWRRELGKEPEIAPFLGRATHWRRVSETWLDPDLGEPGIAFEIASRIVDYIIVIEPRRRS